MKLKDLAPLLDGRQAVFGAEGDVEIAGLTADSRGAGPNILFVALPGSKADGARYAADAVQRGSRVVVAGRDAVIDAAIDATGAQVLRVDDARLFLARAAAAFHGRQPEHVVAVTGTAGKTSVASFTRQIWARAGNMAAMIGTTGVVSPSRNDYGSLTTPDPVALHALLADLADEGVTHAAMEASSHGLDQHRLAGVRLGAAAFTNLGRDHLDYHPDMASYLDAKLILFRNLLPRGAPAVVFADDAYSQAVVAAAQTAGHAIRTVGRTGEFLTLKRVEQQRRRQIAEVFHDGRIVEIDLPLAGDFQLSNALVAAGLALSTGTDANAVFAALEHLEGASGRLELIGTTRDGAPAYVDYAHKPEALENVLRAVRPFTTGRVIVVFGCGGDRDRGKRPIMGEIATRLADVVIVTDDNPRSETPAAIRQDILAAAPEAKEIGDRAEAIDHAVGMLKAGDTLIVAGKGHEEGQTVGTQTLPFSDHAQLRNALERRA